MQYFVGLMSGTSLDGVDAALLAFDGDTCSVAATFYLPYPDSLKHDLLALHAPGAGELEKCQHLGIRLAKLYAQAIHALLNQVPTTRVVAIGCHGQTIRHRPEHGFSIQLNNPALLAELTGITVVADFRSRDIAAGGQGAPLVPAFHRAVFGHPVAHRVIVNIGGISNLTNLPPRGSVTGFDCGPGNILMDAWCQRHLGLPFDRNGDWAKTGQIIPALLETMLEHPFFHLPPPKSTGRDIFNMAWLESLVTPGQASEDIQATLLELSARSIKNAIRQHCGRVDEIYLCGGGARNETLRMRLQRLLGEIPVFLSDSLGIPVDWVEAAAFAWLAKQTLENQPGNLPTVTGASGPRVLGAIYPA
jgi:anhydro-N-acetylmuramic acid kinase